MATRAQQHRQGQRTRDRQASGVKLKTYDIKGLYNSVRWKSQRKHWLSANPLCAECSRGKRVTEARVVDHITPHRGNEALFWDQANWQSLCKLCHDTKTALETRSVATVPLSMTETRARVILVCGAPGVGRSQYARARMGPDDLLFDEEEEACRHTPKGLPPTPRYEAELEARKVAAVARNALAKKLGHDDPTHGKGTIYITMQCAKYTERREWTERLGARCVVILKDPHDVLMATSSTHAEALANSWWKRYTSGVGEEVLEYMNGS